MIKKDRHPVRIYEGDLRKLQKLLNISSPSKAILMSIALIKIRSKFVHCNEIVEKKIRIFMSNKINCGNKISIFPTIHNDDVNFLYARYDKNKNSKSETFTDIVRCLIYEVTYILSHENNLEKLISEELCKNTKKRKKSFQRKERDINNPLIRIDGKKSNQLTDIFNSILLEGSKHHLAYAEPFTGTTSVFCHLNSDLDFKSYELNDLNSRTLNFIKVIQNTPNQFKLYLSMLNYNSDVFSNIKEYCKKCNNNFKTKIEDALCFFFLNYSSFKNSGGSFCSDKETYRLSQIKYLKTIGKIDYFHEKYQGVKITKSDAFYFIKKHINCSDMLLYVDSPYPYTEEYYKDVLKATSKKGSDSNPKYKNTPKKKKVFDHEKLSNLLCSFEGNFVYSCRTTFSKANQKEGFPNYEMVCTIDKLYKGRNLYYLDIPYRNEQTERVITNFYFKGAKEYK